MMTLARLARPSFQQGGVPNGVRVLAVGKCSDAQKASWGLLSRTQLVWQWPASLNQRMLFGADSGKLSFWCRGRGCVSLEKQNRRSDA